MGFLIATILLLALIGAIVSRTGQRPWRNRIDRRADRDNAEIALDVMQPHLGKHDTHVHGQHHNPASHGHHHTGGFGHGGGGHHGGHHSGGDVGGHHGGF